MFPSGTSSACTGCIDLGDDAYGLSGNLDEGSVLCFDERTT
jgi:hypothetical protein